jgi:hypothetical protein
LLTLERDGVQIHAHDGSRCERIPPAPAAPPEPDEAPEPPAWVAGSAPAPAPAPIVEPPTASPAPLAYETVRVSEPPAPEAADRAPRSARRSRPWLLVGALLAVVLLIGAGVTGGLIARNAVNREKDRTAAAEHRTTSLEEKLADKDATIAGQRDQISAFEQQQEQLRQREQQLEQRERALQAPQGPNATSFGDGIYQARVAIQPGEYRTDGTDSCYWAKLSTGDTNSIIENNFVAGPQTVTVDSPYFESENCGTWTKVTNE